MTCSFLSSYLTVYFWLHWIFLCVGFLWCGEQELLSRRGARASRCGVLSGCGAQSARVVAQRPQSVRGL